MGRKKKVIHNLRNRNGYNADYQGCFEKSYPHDFRNFVDNVGLIVDNSGLIVDNFSKKHIWKNRCG